MKRMLCIWFPHWPLQRLLVAKPELEQRAVILYSRWGNRGQRVTACSAQAAAAGVRPGMPLAEATALLHQLSPERGSPASVAARSKSRAAAPPSGSAFYTEASQETADRAELQRLAAWCERFSPIVGLESTSDPAGGDPPEPASLILDVSGLGPLFGGEASLGTRIVAELEQQGYASRVAIADSLGAAWAVAHGALPEQAPGCWVVPPGQTAATLESYPLHVLRLPESTCETLQQLGIQQIRQLLRLPRPSLLARFGPTILLRLDQALGILQEPITTHRAAPIFEASWSLEYPTDQRSAIEFVVQQLIQRVAHLLAEQHRGAVRLEVHLRCISPSSDSQSVSDGESELGSPVPATPRPQLVFRVDLFRPTAVCAHLVDLTRLQFDQVSWPTAVDEVRVLASVTALLDVRQGNLFEQGIRDNQRELSLFIDRLSSRLGRDCVLRPRLIAEAQPERACRYSPWSYTRRNPTSLPAAARRARPSRSSDTAAPEPLRSPPEIGTRPLQLLHPPVDLEVETAAPQGPPLRIRCEQSWHVIVRHWGPERIETGWWRGTITRRDYYRVETQQGLQFWVFRQLTTRRWFLQGQFT